LIDVPGGILLFLQMFRTNITSVFVLLGSHLQLRRFMVYIGTTTLHTELYGNTVDRSLDRNACTRIIILNLVRVIP
jgi:hypothetical protein